MFRAKARWYAEGEKNTKYFYRLEKQRANYKTMNCLIRPDGTISRNQKRDSIYAVQVLSRLIQHGH